MQQIASRIGCATDSLPVAWWDTIGQALTLLCEITSGAYGSPDTQRGILYTLRHYPDQGLIDFLARVDSLEGWFKPERDE